MLGTYTPRDPIQPAWITLDGPDARDFLHRLTTVDARALDPGQGAPGCFLNPQGRIRAYFQLWALGPDSFAFELDAGADGRWKRELLTAIDQFTFAEQMALKPRDELESRWMFFAPGSPLCASFEGLGAGETRELEGGVRLSHHGERDFGRQWITAWGPEGRLDAWIAECFPGAPALELAQLEAWRIAALRPRPGTEITETVMPLEVGLPDAIAPNKGCYPGQEVIEKIISLGAPPRRLARFEGQGARPWPGEKLFNLAEQPVEIGEVTSVSSREGGGYAALAIVKKIHAREGLPVRTADGGEASISGIAPYA